MQAPIHSSPDSSELGKKSEYETSYNPDKLFPISRQQKRIEIGIDSENLPFFGYDCWNHYEVSWLNQKGKPVVATAEIYYDCASPNIIESKSMKLYFNTFNNTKFDSINTVQNLIINDLSKSVGGEVVVHLSEICSSKAEIMLSSFAGISIDQQNEVEFDVYQTNADFLTLDGEEIVEEVLYSDLLKSNCLVTNQPDWGSVEISYKGNKINREGLLKYIVSFRNHNEFHEQCVERIYVDIMRICKPTELSVNARYTRRGGLDINPFRTSHKNFSRQNRRLVRQ